MATWARTYPEALKQIKQALTKNQVTNLISTGHSLGAAVSTLDALALANDLNGSIPIEHIGFGSPRVFNPIGAALVDQVVKNPQAKLQYHHVHHDADPVPHLAPLILLSQHSSNEVFLPDDKGTAVSCPGRENVNCSLGRKQLDFADHTGPYRESMNHLAYRFATMLTNNCLRRLSVCSQPCVGPSGRSRAKRRLLLDCDGAAIACVSIYRQYFEGCLGPR